MTSDTTVDLRNSFAGFLNEAAKIVDEKGRIVNLEEIVLCLEDERGRIDELKREFPLCVQLVTHVIEILGKEVEQSKAKRDFEEFMANKYRIEEENRRIEEEKKSWSNELHLWIGTPCDTDEQSAKQKKLSNESRNKVNSSPEYDPLGKSDGVMNGRPLGSPNNCGDGRLKSSRKARLRWSPELHRRFVRAIQQLGGAQVATPKQIMELMKVDGLTGDEVKSHLQKYRLRVRSKVSNRSASASRPVSMNGSIWLPYENYTPSTSSQSASLSGSSTVI